jgi:hypothetical protein
LLPLTIFLHHPHPVPDVFSSKYPISLAFLRTHLATHLFFPLLHISTHTLPLGPALCVVPGRPTHFIWFPSLSGVFVGRINYISWLIISLLHKTDPSRIPCAISEPPVTSDPPIISFVPVIIDIHLADVRKATEENKISFFRLHSNLSTNQSAVLCLEAFFVHILTSQLTSSSSTFPCQRVPISRRLFKIPCLSPPLVPLPRIKLYTSWTPPTQAPTRALS